MIICESTKFFIIWKSKHIHTIGTEFSSRFFSLEDVGNFIVNQILIDVFWINIRRHEVSIKNVDNSFIDEDLSSKDLQPPNVSNDFAVRL